MLLYIVKLQKENVEQVFKLMGTFCLGVCNGREYTLGVATLSRFTPHYFLCT